MSKVPKTINWTPKRHASLMKAIKDQKKPVGTYLKLQVASATKKAISERKITGAIKSMGRSPIKTNIKPSKMNEPGAQFSGNGPDIIFLNHIEVNDKKISLHVCGHFSDVVRLLTNNPNVYSVFGKNAKKVMFAMQKNDSRRAIEAVWKYGYGIHRVDENYKRFLTKEVKEHFKTTHSNAYLKLLEGDTEDPDYEKYHNAFYKEVMDAIEDKKKDAKTALAKKKEKTEMDKFRESGSRYMMDLSKNLDGTNFQILDKKDNQVTRKIRKAGAAASGRSGKSTVIENLDKTLGVNLKGKPLYLHIAGYSGTTYKKRKGKIEIVETDPILPRAMGKKKGYSPDDKDDDDKKNKFTSNYYRLPAFTFSGKEYTNVVADFRDVELKDVTAFANELEKHDESFDSDSLIARASRARKVFEKGKESRKKKGGIKVEDYFQGDEEDEDVGGDLLTGAGDESEDEDEGGQVAAPKKKKKEKEKEKKKKKKKKSESAAEDSDVEVDVDDLAKE